MINVKKDQGSGQRRIGDNNRERVRKWFLSNPDMTVSDCAKALGLTWPTVKRHVVSIQNKS